MKRCIVVIASFLIILGLAGIPAMAQDVTPPPAPTLSSPLNGDTVGGHVTKLQWNSVSDPSGVTYHIKVAEMGGGPVIHDVTGITGNSIDLALFDDNYEWTCTAVDGAGNVSPDSTMWYFQVLNADTAPSDLTLTYPTGADTGPPDVSITFPNGGESLTGGSEVTITWTGADDITPSSQLNMGVYYSLDNGNSWSIITKTSSNSGSCVWSVPNVDSDQCLIRVLGRDHELKVGVDTSDSVFSIVSDSSKSLDSISSDSDGGQSHIAQSQFIVGESFIGGQYYWITWYALDDITPTVDLIIVLFLSCDDGHSWSTIASLASNDGAFFWQVPDNITSNKCLIKFTAEDEHGKKGVSTSASAFTITSSSNASWSTASQGSASSSSNSALSACALVFPENGQAVVGTDVTVRWTKSQGAISYKVYYSTDPNFTNASPISVANLGTPKALYAAAGLPGFLLIGAIFTVPLPGRKKFMLLMIALMMIGGGVVACGGGGNDAQTASIASGEVSQQISGLSAGTTYYWKVVADNGQGATVESPVWSFTTK